MRPIEATVINRPMTASSPVQSSCSSWWRAIAYAAAFVPLLGIVVSLWIRPDPQYQEIPDWKPVLALADLARERNDLHEARHLYVSAARIASWGEDWEGLLTAACGMKKMERGPYSATNSLLVRAMMAAEIKQSRAGIGAVAQAFIGIGEQKAAAMLLARTRNSSPAGMQQPSSFYIQGCW